MERIIIFTSFIGTFLVIVSAGVLLWYNPSPKMSTPLVAAVAAIVTVFLSTYFLLKNDTEIEKISFPVSIVFNTQDALPEFFLDRTDVKKTRKNLAKLARPYKEAGTNPPLAINPPKSHDEAVKFCLELLVYKIFLNIEDFQRREWAVLQNNVVSSSQTYKRVKLHNPKIYSGEELLKAESINRFSYDYSDMRKLSGKLILPKETKIEFKPLPASAETGPEKYLLILDNKPYFTITFTAETMGYGGQGVPQDVNSGLTPEQIKKFQTYQFKIDMHAQFYGFTSENPIIEEYKNWTNWIFEEMKNEMSE